MCDSWSRVYKLNKSTPCMEECLVISPFVVSFAEYIATRVFLRFQYISDSQWDQRVKFEQPGTLHWLLKEPSIIGG